MKKIARRTKTTPKIVAAIIPANTPVASLLAGCESDGEAGVVVGTRIGLEGFVLVKEFVLAKIFVGGTYPVSTVA
jgi:hypothetical protein